MSLRAARADDVDALTELAFRAKAFWGYDDAFMAACRDELAVDPADVAAGRVIVADAGEAVTGFATVTGTPPDAELEALFVEPGAMRAGTGGRLFAAAVDLARGLGCSRLLVEADPHAAAFYEAQGAALVGERPSASIPGRTLPLLALDLV